MGCDYWANFYERIFRSNFELTDKDISEIKDRVMLSKLLHHTYREANIVGNKMEEYLGNDSMTIDDLLINTQNEAHDHIISCSHCYKKMKPGPRISL